MISTQTQQNYYQALLNRDQAFDGVFFAGIKTTQIFCIASCPARKPLEKNCEFFSTVQYALLAGYRPCKRCQPLLSPNTLTKVINDVIIAIENNPYHRWRSKDLRTLKIDPSTASRQFKKRFGMTFIAYARARRMGTALHAIRQGKRILDIQLEAGYESSSAFRDAFRKIIGTTPSQVCPDTLQLAASWIDTPLGPMLCICNAQSLYLLEFVERRGLEKEIERLKKKAFILPGETKITIQIRQELKLYFANQLQNFTTPVTMLGTPFQKQVWHALCEIPYGKTMSYKELAENIGKPTAFRAVANANGCNQLALIIPCHRVINNNGELGGYGGGVAKKQWLLDLERQVIANE